MKMKIEFSGLMNKTIPVTQVIESEMSAENAFSVLEFILSGFKAQGFIFNTDVKTLLYKGLISVNAKSKYQKLVDVNETYAGIRIYCKN